MDYYVQNDKGEFVKHEGVLHDDKAYSELKTKVDEFRTTNTNLLKSNETLGAFSKFLGGATELTPDGLQKKIDEMARAKSEEVIKRMQETHEGETTTIKQQNEKLRGTTAKYFLGGTLRAAGSELGVYDSAYDDLMVRASAEFDVDDEGKVVAKGDKKDGKGNPLTVSAWLAEVLKKAPHFVKPTTGPGLSQKRGGGQGLSINTPGSERKSGSISFFKNKV